LKQAADFKSALATSLLPSADLSAGAEVSVVHAARVLGDHVIGSRATCKHRHVGQAGRYREPSALQVGRAEHNRLTARERALMASGAVHLGPLTTMMTRGISVQLGQYASLHGQFSLFHGQLTKNC